VTGIGVHACATWRPGAIFGLLLAIEHDADFGPVIRLAALHGAPRRRRDPATAEPVPVP
jgi:hypothetical protein